jgi:hypothetical protein
MFPAFLLPLLGGAGIGAGIGALTGGGDGAWKGALGGGLLGGGLGAAGAFGGAAAAPTPLLSAFGNPAAQAAVTPSLASLGGAGGSSTGLLSAFGNPAAASITPNLASLGGASTGALGLGGNASALASITPEALATSPYLQGLSGITEATPGFLEGLMPSQDTMTKAYLASLVGKSLMPDQQPQQQALPSRATPIIRGAFGAPVAPRQAIFPQPGFMGARSRRRY